MSELGGEVLSHLEDSELVSLASTHPFFANFVQETTRHRNVLSPNFPQFRNPAPLRSGTGTSFDMTLAPIPIPLSISAVSSATNSPGAASWGQGNSDTVRH